MRALFACALIYHALPWRICGSLAPRSSTASSPTRSTSTRSRQPPPSTAWCGDAQHHLHIGYDLRILVHTSLPSAPYLLFPGCSIHLSEPRLGAAPRLPRAPATPTSNDLDAWNGCVYMQLLCATRGQEAGTYAHVRTPLCCVRVRASVSVGPRTRAPDCVSRTSDACVGLGGA